MMRAHLLSYHIQQGPEVITAKEVHLTLSTAIERAKVFEETDGISHVRLEIIYVHG